MPLKTAVTTSLASTSRHRPGYARASSVSFVDERLLKSPMIETEDDISQAPRTPSPRGLGIREAETTPPEVPHGTPSTIRRVPVKSQGPVALDQQNVKISRPEVSPPSTRGFSGSTICDPRVSDFDLSSEHRRASNKSLSSLHSTDTPSFYQNSERGLLSGSTASRIGQRYYC